jgi:hypothetical protein
LFRAIAGNAIRAVALPEKLFRSRIETLSYRLEILGRDLLLEPEQLSTASVPLALDVPILVVVVALLEMALRITLAVGHGTNRQHSPTLALFEIWGQATQWRGC